MPSELDIVWLAGLLEGEGWFGMGSNNSPGISIATTDRDVIDKVALLLGHNVYGRSRKPPWKQVWVVKITGYKAIEWMWLLHPHMGERRSARIAETLAAWDAVDHKAPRGQRTRAKCHPDRWVASKGLCNACYMRKRRAAAVAS